MADKMAAAYQSAFVHCCGHSNLVFFNLISSKFHIWFASIKPWFKFEYEFCPTKEMASAYQFASLGSCGHSNLSHFYADFFQFSYKDCFHQTLVHVRI